MRIIAKFITAILLVAVVTSHGSAQGNTVKSSKPAEQGRKSNSKTSEKIAWFSTLDSAREEAMRTQKPILLIAARPECQGVPGKW